MKCPNCKYEIDYEHYICEMRCSSTEIWWCKRCGSIAIGYDCCDPDEWNIPNER